METFKKIPLDLIDEPSYPIRTNLTPASIAELADSIKENGLIEPIVVVPNGGRFEVVAGHRRLLACRVAELLNVPCSIIDGEGLDLEKIKIHENLQRDDVTPIEEAHYFEQLKDTYKATSVTLAALTGKSTNYILQRLNILKYPPALFDALNSGKISFSAARELSTIDDPATLDFYTDLAARGGVNPQTVIQWRKEWKEQRVAPADPTGPNVPVDPQSVMPPVTVKCRLCSAPVELTKARIVHVHEECLTAIE